MLSSSGSAVRQISLSLFTNPAQAETSGASLLHRKPLPAMAQVYARLSTASGEISLIKVSFAAARPEGAYALAIPARSDDALEARLGALGDSAALAARAAEAQRFERELGGIAETFLAEGDEVRRLLILGLGGQPEAESGFERAGGALTARLLVSGETRLVVDLSGLNVSGRDAARLAFGAAARSWRYDQYRTKLPRKQQPTLTEIVIVGGGADAAKAWPRY